MSGRLMMMLLSFAAYAQDWPQLLGPDRNLLYKGPWSEKSSFAQVWNKAIGEGFSEGDSRRAVTRVGNCRCEERILRREYQKA